MYRIWSSVCGKRNVSAFERAVVPKHSLAHLNAADYPGMKLVGAAYISDAIHALKSDRL